jgi:Ran GTPase-activating protein (RanGAP) involved in mRNA processing and transport
MLLQLLKLIFKNLKNDIVTNLKVCNEILIETYLYTIYSRIFYVNTHFNSISEKCFKNYIYTSNEDYYSMGTGLVIKNSVIDTNLITYVKNYIDSNLFTLELVGNRITQDGFDDLLENFRAKESLRIIHLDKNEIVKAKSDDLILKLINRLHNLERLTIANVKLSTRGRVSFLGQFKDLRYINITGLQLGLEGCKEMTTYMKRFNKVNYLNLSDNNLRTKGVNVLTNSLYLFKDLSHLNLAKNRIGSDAVAILITCLTEKLEYLNLNDNKIDIKGVSELAAIIPTVLKNLRIFCIGNNRIGNKACLLLINAFCEIKKLVNIDFSRNNLTDEIRDKISNSLFYMKNVGYMDLRYNKIKAFEIREDLKLVFS